MPLIVVNRGPDISDKVYLNLIENLRKIVAEALTCENPDGMLTALDVELWTRQYDPMWDRGVKKLQILIFANDYPERRVNLDDRRNKIIEEVRNLLPSGGVHGWVWVRLAPSSFGEF